MRTLHIMRIKPVFLSIIAGLLVVACHDNNYNGESESAPVIYGTVSPYVPGTTDVMWKASKTLGIYMTRTGSANIYTNIPYTASVMGNTFAQFYAKSEIYFPASGESADIIMYAPYNNAATDDNLIPLSTDNQHSPVDIDVLYAKSTGHSNTASNVQLNIKHLLAKVRFKVSAEQNGVAASTEGFTMKLTNIAKEGTFNLLTEAFTLNHRSECSPAIDEKQTYQASAFIIPTAAEGITLYIYLPAAEKMYTAKLSDYVESLESATLYTFSVKLDEAGAKIKLESIVNDWKEGNGNGENITVKE